MTHAAFAKIWGESNLMRIPREELDHISLSTESKRFLSECGLPVKLGASEGALGIRLAPNRRLVRRADYLRAEEADADIEDEPWRDWLTLGSTFEAYLCVVPADGKVYRVDLFTDLDPDFVNSSIEQFVRFLFEYDSLDSRPAIERGETLEDVMCGFESRLRVIDPPALEDESWWGMIGFDMRLGLE